MVGTRRGQAMHGRARGTQHGRSQSGCAGRATAVTHAARDLCFQPKQVQPVATEFGLGSGVSIPPHALPGRDSVWISRVHAHCYCQTRHVVV
jgi:hypothetical protein